MAKKNWTTEREWERSYSEKVFEELLAESGFRIIGIKEYSSKTDYLITKDEGISQEYSFAHTSNTENHGKKNFEVFLRYYKTTKEYFELKKTVESKNNMEESCGQRMKKAFVEYINNLSYEDLFQVISSLEEIQDLPEEILTCPRCRKKFGNCEQEPTAPCEFRFLLYCNSKKTS